MFQNRLNPCSIKLKEIVKSGKYGKVIAIKGIVTWKRDAKYYRHDSWRGKWATEGGGVLINQSIHTLDLMSYLTEDVLSVKAIMFNFSLADVIEVEDTFVAQLKLKNNINALFFATNAYSVTAPTLIEIIFEDKEGKQTKAIYSDRCIRIDDKIIATDNKPNGHKDYWGTSHWVLLKEFYDNNRFFNIGDIENTIYTMFAMYESAFGGGKEIFVGK